MDAKKQIYTREDFERLRLSKAQEMARDSRLQEDALNVKIRAGHEYYWVHQTNWMGEPCLQLPQDLFALQEAVFKSRPDFIVESGVAWGGSIMFLGMVLKALGGQKVIGIDVFIPPDLRERLESVNNPVRDMIHLIEGSSTDEENLARVRDIIGPNKKVLVLLDSDHQHDHVLRELRMYSPLVSRGQYLICGDTTIERQPPATQRPRPWGKGNNPLTALRVFQEECGDFEVDYELENKLLLTNNPGGYLRRAR